MPSEYDIPTILTSGTAGASILAIFNYLKARLSHKKELDGQDWEQMLKLVDTLRDIISSEREHYQARIKALESRVELLETKLSSKIASLEEAVESIE